MKKILTSFLLAIASSSAIALEIDISEVEEVSIKLKEHTYISKIETNVYTDQFTTGTEKYKLPNGRCLYISRTLVSLHEDKNTGIQYPDIHESKKITKCLDED